ncbi:MAG: sn-glycerol-1-phosphate dehydrogenase [Planctomycetaceae bacterium]|jgi:glycerol-1-phosphate dehydrogenase [NAD(P)+]|nr:sn-glycerol-1-phosphate dehydrogenase [Planctomycetaceae bacterium]
MNKIIEETTKRLEQCLPLADETRLVSIGQNNLSQAGNIFQSCFDTKRVVVIADCNTFEAAGRIVNTNISSENILSVEEPFLFQEKEFHADSKHLEEVRCFLAKTDAIPIAVGSGTINDLVKRAAFECQRSYMIIGTAASVDGYTSFGASIEMDGMKQTLTCFAPRVVLIDLEILKHAPQELNAAGYADLLAKIPAGADWILADKIGTEPIHRTAWDIVQKPLRQWLAQPEGIATNNPSALCLLIEGLIMSGLAMQIAKTSRTASGAEHMFSHLWDNQHHTFQGKIPSHGFKVGIGSIAVSLLYEKMLAFTKEEFSKSKQNIAATHRRWHEIEQTVRTNFGNGNLAEQVLEQSRQKYVDLLEIIRRFDVFLEHWDELKDELQRQLIPAAAICEMLRKAKAPSSPEEIGIDRNRLRQSFGQAQLIRYRYNILDFVMETGHWEIISSMPLEFPNAKN